MVTWQPWIVHIIITSICVILLVISFFMFHQRRKKEFLAKQHRLSKKGTTKLRMMCKAIAATQSLGLHMDNEINTEALQMDYVPRNQASGDSNLYGQDFGTPFGGGSAGLSAGGLDDPSRKKGGLLMFDFRKQQGRTSGDPPNMVASSDTASSAIKDSH